MIITDGGTLQPPENSVSGLKLKTNLRRLSPRTLLTKGVSLLIAKKEVQVSSHPF